MSFFVRVFFIVNFIEDDYLCLAHLIGQAASASKASSCSLTQNMWLLEWRQKTTAFAVLEVALFPKLWTGVGSVILFHTTRNGAMASWGDHTSALKKSRLYRHTLWEAPAPTKCHLLSSSGLILLCPRVQLLFSHDRISRWLCGLGNWSSFVFLRLTQLDSSPPDPWMDFASHPKFLAPPKGHSWVQISKTYDSCCIRQ